jgi:xanthine dehydrogenase YagS FAD-binding subunit
LLLYELPSFMHEDAKTVEEAASLLHKYGDKARLISGGTDLLSLMKDRIQGPELSVPEVLINIKRIPALIQIAYGENGDLTVGSAVTLNRLETSDVIKREFSVLSQAAGLVGTTQIRNMGTVGGNILQRPRCMYFRHPHFICRRKGGSECYAINGEHRYYHSILRNGKCVATHPSDIAAALIALNATAVIASSGNEKEIPVREVFSARRDFSETVLEQSEILKEIKVPGQKGRTHQLFLKNRLRHSTDFSLVSVASVARISDGLCEEIRIVLGGIAPFPYVATMAEETVKGKRLSEALIVQAAEASVEGARPLSMNRFKVPMTKALVKRLITSLWRAPERS